MHFNNVEVNPDIIRAIMINEVVPSCPEDDFYGKPDAAYMSTAIPLFRKAGIEVNSALDILNKGIYITNAVKMPKTEYAVSKESIEENLPYLERELALFPNVRVIMLMGDVAKKAFNMISKKASRKNAIPSISTCVYHYAGWQGTWRMRKSRNAGKKVSNMSLSSMKTEIPGNSCLQGPNIYLPNMNQNGRKAKGGGRTSSSSSTLS